MSETEMGSKNSKIITGSKGENVNSHICFPLFIQTTFSLDYPRTKFI